MNTTIIRMYEEEFEVPTELAERWEEAKKAEEEAQAKICEFLSNKWEEEALEGMEKVGPITYEDLPDNYFGDLESRYGDYYGYIHHLPKAEAVAYVMGFDRFKEALGNFKVLDVLPINTFNVNFPTLSN